MTNQNVVSILLIKCEGGILDSNFSASERHELRILELVEGQDKVTQRGVAADLQIAIGMANSLIKMMIHKGYIKVKDAPSTRYGYYLTPKGFLAKSQLVSKYILDSVKFFSEVRRDYETIAAKLVSEGRYCIGCVGTGDILEIAQMVFHSYNIKTIVVLDIMGHLDKGCLTEYSQIPSHLKSQIDGLVLTESQRPHRVFEIISLDQTEKFIFSPAFMKITKTNYGVSFEQGKQL